MLILKINQQAKVKTVPQVIWNTVNFTSFLKAGYFAAGFFYNACNNPS